MIKSTLRARNKKGFTLMELLIVVAIIAILVAISIPTFSSQLTKAKTATDDANLRAAKAVFATSYLTDNSTLSTTATYYYDAVAGTISTTAPAAYGKLSGHSYVSGTFTADGPQNVAWVAAPAS